jgi:hypothetical protein
MFYISEILFLATILVMVVIKIFGPWLLVYVMIESARVGLENGEITFFLLGLFSIITPAVVLVIGSLIRHFCCKGSVK